MGTVAPVSPAFEALLRSRRAQDAILHGKLYQGEPPEVGFRLGDELSASAHRIRREGPQP